MSASRIRTGERNGVRGLGKIWRASGACHPPYRVILSLSHGDPELTATKSALVTGANKGIGREVARRLAVAGFRVWLGARDAERGTAAARALNAEGLDARWLKIDVTQDESVTAAVKAVAAEGPCLDVLVNNAGIAIQYDLPPSQQRIADIQATFEVNVFGPIRVTQGFLPLLLAAPAARIVMVSSYSGSIGRALDTNSESYRVNMLGYGSSKTALNAITVAFAKELAPKGFKVNAAAPGYTATDLNGYRGRRTVQQAAEIIVRLATLDADGPSGGYFDEGGPLPW